MKILVNGASPAVSFQTWPDYLKKKTGHEVVNLAQDGAGSTYIHDSTILELSRRNYDLVVIQWVDFERIEYRVNQKMAENKRGLWALKTNPHHHYVQNDWVFRPTTFKHDSTNEEIKLFENLHTKFSSSEILLTKHLTAVVSLQGFLKSMDVPYVFCFYRNPVGFHRCQSLYSLIDDTHVYEDSLYQYAKQHKQFYERHPTHEAQEAYTNRLIAHLTDKNLLK
jgi:hypothetical protein